MNCNWLDHSEEGRRGWSQKGHADRLCNLIQTGARCTAREFREKVNRLEITEPASWSVLGVNSTGLRTVVSSTTGHRRQKAL
jgi:hypothetical protein